MTQKRIPLIEVKGNHKEIGQQIGEACRPQIQHSIENAKKLVDTAYDEIQLTWDNAQMQSRKYIPFAEERYPQYVEEMLGIAEGANVEFDHIAVVNVMEAVTSDALHLTKCTSMAVNQQLTLNGTVLVAHNEDWVPEDEPDVFLIHAKPNDEPPFLAMTYGALLPNIGFNAYGIAQCCDSVYPEDSRIGIPRVIVSRAVLAAKTPDEALRNTLVSHRAAGYNHLIAHESGELYNVEVSAREFALLYGEDGFLAHTNFYLDSLMHTIEDEPDELISARIRYYRALRLLKMKSHHTIETLQSILRDHVNYPDSICNHATGGNPLDREKTITSLIIDLSNRKLLAASGNPCEADYDLYELSA